jgi:hypothetical protein
MLYHTENPSPSKDEFISAIAAAIAIAVQNESNEIAIAVHGKGNLDGIVSDAIGASAVKALQKPGGTIQYKGITIYLITEKIRSGFKSGVIVATHVSTKYLNKLLSDYRATDIVYVPWGEKELNDYLLTNKSSAI